MKKRVLYLLLCAVMILGLMPAAVFADDTDGEPVLDNIPAADDNVLNQEIIPSNEEEILPDDIRGTILDNPTDEVYTEDIVKVLVSFSDVSQDDWFCDCVGEVVDKGLMNGVGEGKFDPNGNITRGMVATILYRLEGEPAFMNDNTYTDVERGSYYEKAIIWCSSGKTNIVQGYGNDLFGPDDNITREQLAKMLYNYACYKECGFTGDWMFNLDYRDRNFISEWAYEAMAWCVMNGIINGYEDASLKPQGTATRAEAAKMLTTFIKKVLIEMDETCVGSYENPEGCRLTIEEDENGTFLIDARIVTENPELTNAMTGHAVFSDGCLYLDFNDPTGNHSLATMTKTLVGYDITFTGSMWEAIETGTVFKDFVKNEDI